MISRSSPPPVREPCLFAGASGKSRADARVTRMSRRSSLVLGALPGAVPCARLHARQVLREWAVPVDLDTAELLISELATNGLKAAWATGCNPPISLTMSVSGTVVAIEVWDGIHSLLCCANLMVTSLRWTRKAVVDFSSSTPQHQGLKEC